MVTNINIKLQDAFHINLNKIHKEKSCIYCNRSYPSTILNIEGIIHHNEKPRCLDTKECNKIKKKINK